MTSREYLLKSEQATTDYEADMYLKLALDVQKREMEQIETVVKKQNIQEVNNERN